MPRHTGPVLVDTNAILESHRVGAWRALTGGYGVETVEDCVTETQTGFQRRRAEEQIEVAQLRASLRGIHAVSDAELAKVMLLSIDIALDIGERSLWAHALMRNGKARIGYCTCRWLRKSATCSHRTKDLSRADPCATWRRMSP